MSDVTQKGTKLPILLIELPTLALLTSRKSDTPPLHGRRRWCRAQLAQEPFSPKSTGAAADVGPRNPTPTPLPKNRGLRRREAEELHPPSRTRKSASPVLEPLIQVRPSDDEEDRRRPRRLDNQRYDGLQSHRCCACKSCMLRTLLHNL